MVGVRMISPGHIKRNEERNEDFHLEKMAFQLPKSGLTPSTSASGLDPSLSGQWLLWLRGKMELLTRMTLLLKNQNHSKHSTCTTADVGVHKSWCPEARWSPEFGIPFQINHLGIFKWLTQNNGLPWYVVPIPLYPQKCLTAYAPAWNSTCYTLLLMLFWLKISKEAAYHHLDIIAWTCLWRIQSLKIVQNVIISALHWHCHHLLVSCRLLQGSWYLKILRLQSVLL